MSMWSNVKIANHQWIESSSSFPFYLSLPFISSALSQQILNNKEDVILHMSLAQVRKYLQEVVLKSSPYQHGLELEKKGDRNHTQA